MRNAVRLELPLIPATSPSLVESMRACLLRAGMSKTPGIWAYVLSNPKAWLGTAYHSVLKRLPELSGAEGPSRLQELWQQEIGRLEQQASGHPLNRRYGAGTSWRGYYLVLETLKIRAANLAPAQRVQIGNSAAQTFREEDIVGFGGKLKGKPDLGRGDEIIDFKTGNIYEVADEEDTSPALKQAYVRQLRLYAYLIHEATGRWPRRGLLYPIAGPPVEIDVDPPACVQEATEAVALLDRYNALAAQASDPAALASPSPDACRWCPFKMLCPAFWGSVGEGWALDGDAVTGALLAPPQPIHGEAGFSLSIAVDGGTVPHAAITLAPLPAAVHPNLAGLTAGSRVRVTGLSRRVSGAIFPTIRSVAFAEDQLPAIQMLSAGR
jgi:hypothetical protein